MASFASWLRSSFFISLFFLLQSLFSAVFARNVHIVYMGERSYDEPELVEEAHHQILSNILGSKEAAKDSILYSYKHGFSGFAAVLTKSQAKLIADFPGVVRVVPDRIFSPQTTRSWDFLQVEPGKMNGILVKAQLGVGSIVGILDTGIWPESKSFRDVGLLETPLRWKGICQGGDQFNRNNIDKFYPIVYGEDIPSTGTDEETAGSCSSDSLNATLARGKVVLCFQSRTQRSVYVATDTVKNAGGIALIFAQFPTKDITLSTDIPLVQVDYTIGTYLLTYIGTARNPVVKFSPTKTTIGQLISPEVAHFSSRGPSSISPSVNLNLPSISIPDLKKTMTVSRTVTNVGPQNSVYIARIEAPPGTSVSVEPSILAFNSTKKKLKFKVTFCANLKVQGRYSFGYLFWEDGFHVARIPLTVRTAQSSSQATL
ncbi:Subtilisin-like protease, fibronectin type-III domain [Dillenia turbinata]|uniref:Subtilisin-like protease, fibronectin type-III domain n=1 Tax=Dillenia turbinata TaxID=194707 RepID=A0AAN8URF5_9MAGN